MKCGMKKFHVCRIELVVIQKQRKRCCGSIFKEREQRRSRPPLYTTTLISVLHFVLHSTLKRCFSDEISAIKRQQKHQKTA